LVTTVWYPARGAPGGSPVPGAAPDTSGAPYPLIVFAHGLRATPQDYAALLSRWAAAGFVVAAPLFPLTHADTPGGFDQDDQFNQPADMRFVITSMLARLPSPLTSLVSPTQIGVAGHSDGAVTTLAFLNTCCSDPRVKAAEVLAGDPEPYPGGRYRQHGNPATLFVHGTLDTFLPYDQMVTFFNEMKGPKAFLSLTGAGHADWLQPSAKWFGSVAATTSDFWLAHLQHGAAAAHRLPHDAKPGVSVLYSAPAPGSSLTAPLLSQPKTDRRASVSSTRNLTSGDEVTVRWKGFLPGRAVNVLECSSLREAGCDVAAGRLLVPDPKGSGEVTLGIVVGAVGDGTCDAEHPHCQVLVNDAGLEAPSATVNIPITVGSGPPR
jgi:dienelactone hydrolase